MPRRTPEPVVPLGSYPTPVQLLAALSGARCELWVKRDDRTHLGYGGNKVRKLERLLARARGARRLVTAGAVGSHHVLATAYFGRRLDFEVEAVLFPQPATVHVVETIRAAISEGLRAYPVGSPAQVPLAIARRVARGARLIALGGSSVSGSMGYVDAARELGAQVRAGAMPEPDLCVVALGSGGTAAGLAAGFAAEGMKTRVVGVCVVNPIWPARLVASALARACARRAGERSGGNLEPRLTVDGRFLGRGYGHETAEGRAALEVAAAKAGLLLDPTYTAKAFAAALALVRETAFGRPARCLLYWHTLSSAPLAPLLERAPVEGALAPALRALLRARVDSTGPIPVD